MPREDTLGSLGSREAAFAADEDIAARHGTDKRAARLRIAAKLTQFWVEYKNLPLLQKPGFIDKSNKLTSEGARKVRSEVVRLLREAPLTHGFNPAIWFSASADVGTTMKNCWHLNLGSNMREKTESHLFRYTGANATPQMQTYAAGGKASNTFSANTRPFYASLNYSRAKCGGSSGYGKTHFIMRNHMRFNATYTSMDSFGIETEHQANGWTVLANYHNVYPIIVGVPNGANDQGGKPTFDVLKSMIDHALGRVAAPMEEFDGRQYIEAQIPGDIHFARDIDKVVIDSTVVPRGSVIGKRCDQFAAQHSLLIKFV